MLIAILASFVVVLLDPGSGDEPKAAHERFLVLKREYDAAHDAFAKASAEAKTDAEVARLDSLPGKNPRGFAVGFMALARRFPGTEAAEDALVWVASHVMFGPETEVAKRLLIRDHVRSAGLATVFAFQRFTCGSEATECLLREAKARSPHRNIQGLACY